MSRRIFVLQILVLSPTSAFACCPEGEIDPVAFIVIVALCVLMAPAFLIPFAGILALRPELSTNRLAVFAAYMIFGITVVVAGLLWDLPSGPAILLLVLAVVAITAPSVYYFVVAYRTARNSLEG